MLPPFLVFRTLKDKAPVNFILASYGAECYRHSIHDAKDKHPIIYF